MLPPTADVVSVDVEDYVPTTGDPKRPGGNTREVEHITVDGKKGILVKKVFDGGRYRYGGPLEELWVDQVAHENFQMLYDDPLSLIGFTSSVSILKRQSAGDEWKVKAETSTRVWTEKDQAGQYYFKYTAMVKTFIADTEGRFNPFEQKTVEGSIPRLWV